MLLDDLSLLSSTPLIILGNGEFENLAEEEKKSRIFFFVLLFCFVGVDLVQYRF